MIRQKSVATLAALACATMFPLAGCTMDSMGQAEPARSGSSMGAAMMSGDHTVMVGGAAMYPTRTIVQNALNSRDHTTLVAAVQAAGLVDTLSGPGPFTVFAPTNDAFGKLPAGTVDTLLRPENRNLLRSVLTYHVVAGRLTGSDLMQRVRDGGGRATLTTVQGQTLTVTESGSTLKVSDARGDTADVTIGDVIQSNGVIHVVDTVLQPQS